METAASAVAPFHVGSSTALELGHLPRFAHDGRIWFGEPLSLSDASPQHRRITTARFGEHVANELGVLVHSVLDHIGVTRVYSGVTPIIGTLADEHAAT